MESFTGRITKDGKTIAEDIEGSIFHPPGALASWHGTLDTRDAEAAHQLILMDWFEIELDDGRHGRATGSSHTGGTSIVAFTGTGPLK